MRDFYNSGIPFNLAVSFVINQEIEKRKFNQSLVIDVLCGLGINEDQVKAVINSIQNSWSGSVGKEADDLVKVQESTNLIADLYGEFIRDNLPVYKKETRNDETPQRKINNLRRTVKSIIRIDFSKCDGCRKCLPKCTMRAIVPCKTNSMNLFKIDLLKCNLCGECLKDICPQKAIERVN